MLTDNLAHRALFTLPPIRPSAESAPAVRTLPEQKVVTGDKEVDAVLWLRDVIKTGQAGAVTTALEAAKKIKTPLKEIEQRYVDYVKRTSGNNPFAVMFSFGFATLRGWPRVRWRRSPWHLRLGPASKASRSSKTLPPSSSARRP